MSEAKKHMSKKTKIILLSIVPALIVLYLIVVFGLYIFEPTTVKLSDLNSDPTLSHYELFDKSKNDKLYIQPVKPDMMSLIPKDDVELYVHDTVILVAEKGVSYEQIEKLAKKHGASICGYIECASFYQFNYNQGLSYEELCDKCSELKEEKIVKTAVLDYTEWLEEHDEGFRQGYYAAIDAFNENKEDELSRCEADWNKTLSLINIDEAYKYEDSFKKVNVGVLDELADYSHPDLKIANKSDYANEDLSLYDSLEHLGHATHVSGIIGANHDGVGVDGVCKTANLYSYSISNKPTSFWIASMCKMLHYDDVKVLNVSFGYPDSVLISASMGDEKAIEFIANQAELFQAVLGNLIDEGDEFVICAASGNSNGTEIYRDFFGCFDYGNKPILDTLDFYGVLSPTENKADAKYGFWFEYIEEPAVKDRIIVVGACDSTDFINEDAKEIALNQIMDFSINGERVDIVAPGNTYSTTPENTYMEQQGTSMAAPFVSGTAALMFAVNDDLTGAQVKELMISACDKQLSTEDNAYTYPVLDTGKAVKAAAECK